MPVPETEAALREAIAGALGSAAVKAGELDAIAMTSQAQTFTIRRAAGAARIPLVSWRDTRAETSCLAAAALTDFGQHCSASECLPLLMVAKLAWLQDESGGRLVGADDLVLMLPTWFVLQLTGTAVVDTNLAAMSGLYSLQEGDWWDEAVRVCGIRACNLPSLTGLGTVAGQTVKSANRYGLPPGIPVVLAGNDQTAGAYGVGIHEQNALLITLGTAQVAYVVCQRVPPPAAGVIRGPYPGGRWYQLVADDHGAGTVDWARTVLDGCGSEALFDRAAARGAADCGGVRFIADGPAGSGRWVDDTLRTTEVDKARAVLLSLVERMAAMLDRLQPNASKKRLLLAGGGSNSQVWLDCLQQRLGKTVHRIETASPTRGAARMAQGHGRSSQL
jgi:xylulokinase